MKSVKSMKFKEEKKFSFIVPVHNVPEDVLKRCLNSIADQDYPNIEVVIVPNGDKKSGELLKKYAKKEWKIVPLDKANACNARNVGFKNSTGEIVSFFNSDYIAAPGMVRMWMDEFEKTGSDFLYGAYQYRTMTGDVYWSKSFDRYSLEVANFIDCGFPLKREFVCEWDTEIKSLQDWDFWLKVTKKTQKGHYLGREISYLAEPPRAKGLSEDSHNNWIERVKAVKDKNGIPMRDILVTSFGAQFHALNIAKMIGADYRDDTLFKPHKYKVMYLIGFYMKPNEPNANAEVLKYFEGCKRIVHFVGADIFWLRAFSWASLKTLSGALKEMTEAILVENEEAQREIKELLGIDAPIVPIPPYTDLELRDLPKEFSVALYLTDKSDFDKYLQKETLSIVKAMPDVQFVGYGDSQTDFKAHNFRMAGNMKTEEWAEFVYDRSAYLRLGRHDTRPMATDEFIIAGRSVITNIPGEHVDYVETSGKLEINKWDKFAPGFNVTEWPDTKKKIIQKIREVKKSQKEQDNVFMAERLAKSVATKVVLNKQKYHDTIRSFVGEKVHA